MKRKTICTKCGHRKFTLISQEYRDVLICKRCGDINIYPKEPKFKNKIAKQLMFILNIIFKISFYIVFGTGILAIMDLADVISIF